MATANVPKLASENPLVIFSESCSSEMSQTLKSLFSELGASPVVHELDETPEGPKIEEALLRLGLSPAVPAVFIGGKLVGGAKEVMARHLDGSLKQMLMGSNAVCFS